LTATRRGAVRPVLLVLALVVVASGVVAVASLLVGAGWSMHSGLLDAGLPADGPRAHPCVVLGQLARDAGTSEEAVSADFSTCTTTSSDRVVRLTLMSDLADVSGVLARPDCRPIESVEATVCAFDETLEDGGRGSALAIDAPTMNATLSVSGEPFTEAELAAAVALIVEASAEG
jgi:hypothetical protein